MKRIIALTNQPPTSHFPRRLNSGGQAGRDLLSRMLAAGLMLAIVIGIILAWMPGTARAADYALLMAVGKYQNQSFNKLRYAVNDAREFGKVLEQRGYEVKTMTYGENESIDDLNSIPSRDNLTNEMKNVLGKSGKGDRVIMAFSGHGVNINNEAYLCPTDANLRNLSTLIKVEDIRKLIKDSDSTMVMFFCDACQEEIGNQGVLRAAGQNVRQGLKPADQFQTNLFNDPLGARQQKRSIVQSCSQNQFAYEDNELQHGVFSHFLIKAFEGDGDLDRNGEIQHEELVGYLKTSVQDHVYEKFKQHQTVDPAIFGNSDLPLLQLAEGPTWLPADCAPAPDARLVRIQGFRGVQRFYDRIVLTPQVVGQVDPATTEPATTEPLELADGSPMTIEFMLVPQTTFSQPPTFYIARDKITVDQFAAFERRFPDKIDTEAQKLRAGQNAGGNTPAFYVTGMEAIRFARDIWKGADSGGRSYKGALPSPAQWDSAFGKDFDNESGQNAGYALWTGRNASLAGWSVRTFQGLPVDRPGNPDVSPWGVRDLACNGMEYTSMDSFWGALVPHPPNAPEELELRGRSFREDQPLTLQNWKAAGMPNAFLFGVQKVDAPLNDLGFRVVLARSNPNG